jgi:hypothetical protein
MAKRYRHRIGVRAEICFDLILDICDPVPEQISQAVAEALRQAADVDGGFRLEALPAGTVYPDWASVDPEVEPGLRLDPSATGSLDCVEIDSIQSSECKEAYPRTCPQICLNSNERIC